MIEKERERVNMTMNKLNPLDNNNNTIKNNELLKTTSRKF